MLVIREQHIKNNFTAEKKPYVFWIYRNLSISSTCQRVLPSRRSACDLSCGKGHSFHVSTSCAYTNN